MHKQRGVWISEPTCWDAANTNLRHRLLVSAYVYEREALKRLHNGVRQLRLEKEIFKKASQYFAKEMK